MSSLEMKQQSCLSDFSNGFEILILNNILPCLFVSFLMSDNHQSMLNLIILMKDTDVQHALIFIFSTFQNSANGLKRTPCFSIDFIPFCPLWGLESKKKLRVEYFLS